MRKGAWLVGALMGLAGVVWAHGGMDMSGMDHSKMAGHSKGAVKASSVSDEAISLVGEVVDMDCYLMDGSSGKKHESCSAMCLRNGGAVGFLADDGKAYFLLTVKGDPLRYAGGQRFKIDGVLLSRGGAQSIRVDNEQKL